MLTTNQVKYLATISDLKLTIYDGVCISFFCPDNVKQIKVPYSSFVEGMGLPDLRFHWLCSEKCFISGSHIISWILQENFAGDIDFFFNSFEAVENFCNLLRGLKGVGFKESNRSDYAITFCSADNKTIIQAVDIPTLMGGAVDVINSFDLDLCRFAVDADYIYTNSKSVSDLIERAIDNADAPPPDKMVIKKRGLQTIRLLKYNSRGFYVSKKIFNYINKGLNT